MTEELHEEMKWPQIGANGVSLASLILHTAREYTSVQASVVQSSFQISVLRTEYIVCMYANTPCSS